MAITNIDGIPFLWDEEADNKLLGSLFPKGVLPPSFAKELQGISNARFPQFPSPIEWSSNNLKDLLNYYYHNAPTKEIRKKANIYYYKNTTDTNQQTTNLRLTSNQNNIIGTTNDSNENSAWDEFTKIYDDILAGIKPNYNIQEKTPIHYLDNNSNNQYDKKLDTKLLDVTIFVSYDGAALLKQWKSFPCVEDNQLVLFLEINDLDIVSDTVLLARGGVNVMKYINQVGKFKEYIKGDIHIDISEEELKSLFESTQKEDNFWLLQWFVDKWNQVSTYVQDKVDDLKDELKSGFWEFIGKKIESNLRISESEWNSKDPKNTVYKLVEKLTGLQKELDNIKNGSVTFKIKTKGIETTITLNVLPQRVKNILSKFSDYIQDIIQFIKEANVGFAFCVGFWNGQIDLLIGICYLMSMLFEARIAYADYKNNEKYYDALIDEYIDNFIQSVLFLNWFKVVQYAYEKLSDIKKALGKLSFSEEEIAYYVGYVISMFVEITFLPIQLARIAKLQKLEAIITKIQAIINKIVKPIEDAIGNILGVFLRFVDNFVQLLQKGADEVIKFFDELVEKLESLLKKVTLNEAGSGGYLKYVEILSREMFAQEQSISCAAACIRQLAKDFGYEILEADVRKVAGTWEKGTPIGKNISEALTQLTKHEFEGGYIDISNISLEKLENIISRKGKSWIAIIKVEGQMEHAIIVDKIVNKKVYIRDPWPIEGIEKNRKGVVAIIEYNDFITLWDNAGPAAYYLK